MTNTFDHEIYLSPFTWRYGSDAMRQVWSLANQRRLWRRIWVALAEAQAQAGLVTREQVEDLRAHQDAVDIARSHELERDLQHDLMAEVHTYAEQCAVGGGIIHLGATSMDIEDNADALRLREALALIVRELTTVLDLFATQIENHADTTCMAFTHIQPAEPTTLGYRLAFYAQDLLADFHNVRRLQENIRGKGFKGAVGTSASYAQLLDGTDTTPRELEALVMDTLGLPVYAVTHQTYPRRQDWEVVTALAGIAMTVSKFAFDLRLLQSPPFGEWREPFGKAQVGSSAMPFKRNPINAENMNSLARLVASLPNVLWENAANNLLERTLDDSGNRRVVLPQAFLATDELLTRMDRLLSEFTVDQHAIRRNLEVYGTFAATERILMVAVRNGGNRQALHERIRQHSLQAWEAVQQGQSNPLPTLLTQDDMLTTLISPNSIHQLLNADEYIGDAPHRARKMAATIRDVLGKLQ
jgi:adenylosuccinate lyase